MLKSLNFYQEGETIVGPEALACLDALKIKIFSDSADLASIKELYQYPFVKGFTTNPSLMRKAGINDYEAFARNVLSLIKDRPFSFEVFADELDIMEQQAAYIATWGKNVNVKIPITNTQGKFTGPVIRRLAERGVVVNVTAIMTVQQVKQLVPFLVKETPAIISVFAGRIADTGVDPVPCMKEVKALLKNHPKAELLWASTREIFSIFQADSAGCDIITVGPEFLKKLTSLGKNLNVFSQETVLMFFKDATAAGYTIDTAVLERSTV